MEVTRGSGLLEPFLASRRARMADRLLPGEVRHGRLLDIGCGAFPYFLSRVDFREKVGLDHGIDRASTDLELIDFDLESAESLPFPAETFDAVTMLAVLEHLATERVGSVIREVHRILRGGGVFILTTPGGWTAPLLSALAALRLVSSVEIDDHETSYSRKRLRRILTDSPFGAGEIRTGSFELGANNWAFARKRHH